MSILIGKYEFLELVNKYLDRFENLDHKTRYFKERVLEKHLYPYIKDNISYFNEDVIKHFVRERLKKGYSIETIRTYLNVIREFLQWADERGYLSASYDEKAEKDVFRGIKYKNKQKKEIEIYTDEQLRIIDDYLTGKLDGIPKPPIYPILTGFLLHTGMRLAEALNTKLSDIEKEIHIDENKALILIADRDIYEAVLELNPDYRYVINPENPLVSVSFLSEDKKQEIIKQIVKVLKNEGRIEQLKQIIKEIYSIRVREAKFGKERITKMLLLNEDPVYKERFEGFLKYQEHRRERDKADDIYLFSYEIKEGKQIIRKIDRLKESTVKTAFNRYSKDLKRLGYDVEIKAHSFRRTYASCLAERGYPIEVVKELLGHESINTTSKYYMNMRKAIEQLK